MENLELKKFESNIVELYKSGLIKAPVHLSGGNEKQLIKIFKKVKKEDWVFTTYRSHYHALLKGVSKDWLINEILHLRSIEIMNKEHKIVTSAIVGGTLSQAVGAALAIKLKKQKNKVWAFCGDMTSELGIFHECTKYAKRNNLPITFIVEDNGLSTNTPTQKVWGTKKGKENIIKYKYKRIYPHYGCGERINFK